MAQHESYPRLRALIKSLTWRVVATLITFLTSLVITGHATFALSIASADFVFKTIGYYLHERAWDKVDFGKGQEFGNESGKA